jgi:hypothetical protein
MPFLPSFLRPAALAAATLVSTLTPSTGMTTATTVMIAATAITAVTASDAAARPRVRDHRCFPGTGSGRPKGC